ncbi:helix-turn-helix domain-containing protein [Nocardioides sp. MAH-18]|uniref:Helix-turn-helix domain-containing protein n=1 Tax=Nocardioides agri TaxID=2682843 RepID=A0A6L6XXE5_9ACTN|nr:MULTISPECIES: helix-turn-helix transcriptional regulator [unclassified Nocardioides]MBA2952191.1 helix-turn-helix transcriptional regulator [Nocardioides sp. CGMCC 1.13656]MVQ51357.1 helix-turn-helix domain-containing protein [Nocardioides sp. MAH-18]
METDPIGQWPAHDAERHLGQAVKTLREAKGWSQRELVQQLARHGVKMNQSQVAKTERGDRAVRLMEASAFAAVFGVLLDDLVSPRSGIRSEIRQAAFNVTTELRTLSIEASVFADAYRVWQREVKDAKRQTPAERAFIVSIDRQLAEVGAVASLLTGLGRKR